MLPPITKKAWLFFFSYAKVGAFTTTGSVNIDQSKQIITDALALRQWFLVNDDFSHHWQASSPVSDELIPLTIVCSSLTDHANSADQRWLIFSFATWGWMHKTFIHLQNTQAHRHSSHKSIAFDNYSCMSKCLEIWRVSLGIDADHIPIRVNKFSTLRSA